MDVRASLEIALEPEAAFDVVVDELRLALERQGLELDGERVLEGEAEVGQVVEWERGTRIGFRWWPAPWQPDIVTEVAIGFEESGRRTRVTFEHRGWADAVGDDKAELAGWFAGEVLAPLLRATAPVAFGDWLTDRVARRPSGAQARETYRDPLYHWPNFRVLLEELALTADDFLLEVGCGGGAFLHAALESGCRAAAVDHSADMVRLASDVNREAVEAGRLEIRHASADELPFADDRFTAAVMTGVLGFLPHPVAAFRGDQADARGRRPLRCAGQRSGDARDAGRAGAHGLTPALLRRRRARADRPGGRVHRRPGRAARSRPVRARGGRPGGASRAVLGGARSPIPPRAQIAFFAGASARVRKIKRREPSCGRMRLALAVAGLCVSFVGAV